jgi:hypothetical protein
MYNNIIFRNVERFNFSFFFKENKIVKENIESLGIVYLVEIIIS